MILECGCPSTHPDWHDEDIDLGGRCIHRVAVPMLLHMPIGYDVQLRRQQENLQRLGLQETWPGLALVRTGMLRGSLTRLLENARSPSHQVSWLPHPYQVRAHLHHGGLGTLRQVVRDMQAHLLDAGRMPRELLLAHLTCTRCAESRGGEKILLLRHWRESRILQKRRTAKSASAS
jgi:hypothetical protein